MTSSCLAPESDLNPDFLIYASPSNHRVFDKVSEFGQGIPLDCNDEPERKKKCVAAGATFFLYSTSTSSHY